VVGVVGEHGDLGNAAGDHGRPYLAGAQAGERARIDGIFVASAATAAGWGLVLSEGNYEAQ
jgi:hypothetical protein